MHPFPLIIRSLTRITAGTAVGLPCGCNLLLHADGSTKPLWCPTHHLDGEKLRLEALDRRYRNP